MTEKPLILLGAARSGTKFLRDQIAQDPAVRHIPYDVNYVWRYGNDAMPDDVLDPRRLSEKHARNIRATLKKLASLENNRGRILEKTVSNTLRIPFIEKIYPDACYLHLVRDGRAVIESAHRMWQNPPDKMGLFRKLKDLPLQHYTYVWWFGVNYIKGLTKGRQGGAIWGPRYPNILSDIENLSLFEVVTKQWNISVETASVDMSQISESRKLTVKYEDLLSDITLTNISNFCGLTDPDNFKLRMHKSFRPENKLKWKERLDTKQIEIIEKLAEKSLKRYGYLS